MLRNVALRLDERENLGSLKLPRFEVSEFNRVSAFRASCEVVLKLSISSLVWRGDPFHFRLILQFAALYSVEA